MNKLLQGAIKFKEEDYNEHKELYESLKRAQNPDTLFIGCADSRVVPSRITGTLPGELFVVRNVGNIIPPYTAKNDAYLATTSAIEYAVVILGVENIVVCGHSNCGACQALYDENLGANTEHLQKWIELLHPVKEQVALLSPKSIAKRTWLTEQINIEVQINNLLTYPFIQEKLDQGELKIFGWYYIIETGEIMNYDLQTKQFRVIKKDEKEQK
ncbi:carbonic anhydrase [Helicobacter kayseriensis]|uniref:carbonic anhydrase n=1 Tax=Helicobacter kayseriensis TaxID=2905877 RepID=UPI001E561205|nr:carbonic anhydrase [Helicobacter kayseriensis]MCE3047542.1 carbonic anhydrase [Helicobacter kayseriensis]MCE3048864.1 carbonic anhydrase [Helicobacter kayseriensis]